MTTALALPAPGQPEHFNGQDDLQLQQQLPQSGEYGYSSPLLTAQLHRRGASPNQAYEEGPMLQKRELRRPRRSRNDIYSILFNTVTFLDPVESDRFLSCMQWRVSPLHDSSLALPVVLGLDTRLLTPSPETQQAHRRRGRHRHSRLHTHHALGDLTIDEITPGSEFEQQLRAKLERKTGARLEDVPEGIILDETIAQVPGYDSDPPPQEPNQFQELKGGLEDLRNQPRQSWSRYVMPPSRNGAPGSRTPPLRNFKPKPFR